jgi:hypothetical protein
MSSRANYLYLIPEKPKSRGGMADVVAGLPGVKLEVDQATDELALRAKQLLRQHVNQDVAKIETARGRRDGYVVLVDANVTNEENADSNSAASIEFGRAGYVDPDTGEEYGEMKPLRILYRAAKLTGKGGPRVRKIKRRRNPERKVK